MPSSSQGILETNKNNVNRQILSKSHPSAIKNKAIHCLKWGRGTKLTGTSYNFDILVWSSAAEGIFGIFSNNVFLCKNKTRTTILCIHRLDVCSRSAALENTLIVYYSILYHNLLRKTLLHEKYFLQNLYPLKFLLSVQNRLSVLLIYLFIC